MNTRKLATLAVSSLVVVAGCGGDDETADTTRPGRAASNADAPPPKTQEGRIVFSADGDITAINPDGSGRTTLLETDELEIDPRWSPDGRRVAFVRDDALYVMNADGTGIKRVTDPRPGTEAPGWSHHGRRLAFSAESATGFALYVVNVDGTGLRRLHAVTKGFLGDPDFSPDGERIAISLDPTAQGGELDVYILNTDGSGLRRVIRTVGDESGPRWTPDGERLLFGVGGKGIFSVRPDGRGRRKLVGDPLNADTLTAAWSPDGKRIAWTAKFEGGGGSEIFVMNADGSDVKKITEPLPGATSLDW